MATLRPAQYDALERAIVDGRRIAVRRQRREIVVVPLRLFMRAGGEAIEVRHPTTGDTVIIGLDEIDAIEVVQWQ
jgi:hypothetical protein